MSLLLAFERQTKKPRLLVEPGLLGDRFKLLLTDQNLVLAEQAGFEPAEGY